MCRECGECVTLPIDDSPVAGACSQGHSITSDTVKADLGILSAESIEPPVCGNCGSLMRIVEWQGNRFWSCANYINDPKCRPGKPMLRFQEVQERIRREESELLRH
jgi:hypothetical protein